MELIRGDTGKYRFQRKDVNGDVITEKADEVYFTVKTNGYSDNVLIQKTIDDMEFDEEYYYHFTIEPYNTDELEFGTYQYDIEVIQDDLKTTIARGELVIEEEITWASDESGGVSL